jgi:hypothetical protein
VDSEPTKEEIMTLAEDLAHVKTLLEDELTDAKDSVERADGCVTELYYGSDGEEECSSYIEAVIDAACKQAQCDVLNRFLGILERLIRENS